MDGGREPPKSIAELKAAGRMKQRSSPRKQSAASVGASGDEVDDIAVEIMGMSISERPKEHTVSSNCAPLLSKSLRILTCIIYVYSSSFNLLICVF
jgi:hypothetical protein